MLTIDSISWLQFAGKQIVTQPFTQDALKELFLKVYRTKWIQTFNNNYYDGPFLKSHDLDVPLAEDNTFTVKTKANIVEFTISFGIHNSAAFVSASEPKIITETQNLKYFIEQINKQISDICSDLNNPEYYSYPDFIGDIFDTLCKNGISFIPGEDVKGIYKINEKTNMYFPLYAKLSAGKKLEVLSRAYRNFTKIQWDFDAITFSRCLVYELIHQNLVKEINWVDDYVQHKYKLLNYHIKPTIDPQTGKKVRLVKNILALNYVSESNVKKSIVPLDIWMTLSK